VTGAFGNVARTKKSDLFYHMYADDMRTPLILCVIIEARKSSEWSTWYRDINASSSDERIGYSQERYRCTCHADVSHASQLRQPIIKKSRRICSDLHGCTAGLLLLILLLLLLILVIARKASQGSVTLRYIKSYLEWPIV